MTPVIEQSGAFFKSHSRETLRALHGFGQTHCRHRHAGKNQPQSRRKMVRIRRNDSGKESRADPEPHDRADLALIGMEESRSRFHPGRHVLKNPPAAERKWIWPTSAFRNTITRASPRLDEILLGAVEGVSRRDASVQDAICAQGLYPPPNKMHNLVAVARLHGGRNPLRSRKNLQVALNRHAVAGKPRCESRAETPSPSGTSRVSPFTTI